MTTSSDNFSDDQRAMAVLRLYSACERSCASARAVAMDAVDLGAYRDAMAALRAQQDWKLSVAWVLKAVGLLGTTILVYRLTRQQKSQANSWATIAREVGLSKVETEIMYDASLEILLRELDSRGIPDAFWIRPQLQPATARSAASEDADRQEAEAAA